MFIYILIKSFYYLLEKILAIGIKLNIREKRKDLFLLYFFFLLYGSLVYQDILDN